MSQAYSGVQSNVMSGAIDMNSMGWSADHEVNTFDSTTTADAGWDDTTDSTQKVSGSFDFFYTAAKYPYGSALVFPGATPTLKLYINMTAGNFLTGTALITKLSLKEKVKEGFIVTASFTSKGAWTLPTT